MKILKKIIKSDLEQIEEKNVALLFSGGIDSLFLLFSLLELGKNVICYTFCLEGIESSDLYYSKEAAEVFDVPHKTVTLPTDINLLVKEVKEIIVEFGLVKKTEVECTWPLWRSIQQIRQKSIVTGIGSDSYFGLSKRAKIHFASSADLMDQFRSAYFSNPKNGQQEILPKICKKFKKDMYHPFFAKGLLEAFKGKSWEEINKPFEKQVLIDCFPKMYKQIKLRRHQNFQCGDSGITDHFKKLLNTDLNVGDWKSTIGIYNYIRKTLSLSNFK